MKMACLSLLSSIAVFITLYEGCRSASIYHDTYVIADTQKTVNLNGEAIIPCKTNNGQGVIFCEITVSNRPVLFYEDTKSDFSNEDNIVYAGSSLKEGDCTFRIKEVTMEFSGNITCKMGIARTAISANIKLDVLKLPTVKLFLQPDNRYSYENSEKIEAKCIAENGQPAPESIKMKIGEDILESVLEENDSGRSIQVAKFMAKKEYDGKNLSCFVEHPSFQTPLTQSAYLRVRYSPTVEKDEYDIPFDLGNDVSYTLHINGNPQPQIYLQVDDYRIIEGSSSLNGRYNMQQAIPNEVNGGYDVKINIAKVTEEDTKKNFTIIAVNDLGSAQYHLLLKNADTYSENFQIGMWIGGICVLCIIIIFVMKKVFKNYNHGKTKHFSSDAVHVTTEELNNEENVPNNYTEGKAEKSTNGTEIKKSTTDV